MKENDNQGSNEKKPLLQENGNQSPIIQAIESISEEKAGTNLNNKDETPEIQYSNRHSSKPPLLLKQFSSKFNSSVKNLHFFREKKENTAEKINTPNSNILREPVDNTLTKEQYGDLFTSLIKDVNKFTQYRTFNNTFGEESNTANQLKISIEQTLEAINFTENDVDSIISCMQEKRMGIKNIPYEINLHDNTRFSSIIFEELSKIFSEYLEPKPDYDDVQFQLMPKTGYTQMKIGQIKTLLEKQIEKANTSGEKEEKMEDHVASELMNKFLIAIKNNGFKQFKSTLEKSKDIPTEVKKIFTKAKGNSPVTQLVTHAAENFAIREIAGQCVESKVLHI